jgi:CheY-like chemotaxis protein
MLRRLIGEDIELIVRLDPGLGPVRADPSQLEQVIVNLAANARDAMPEGGTLTIETANVQLDGAAGMPPADAQPGAYARLSVRDTGVGMDAGTQARLFEPFFTTKELGKGTGLGLATVYGIVKQAGGYIWVESTLGQGTTFEVYLPESREALQAAPAHGPEASGRTGSETILVVEDEGVLRGLASQALELHGYTVLCAAAGEEALGVARAHAGPIRLLLTDVVMPGMSGRQLAESLAEQRPEMAVLYMSGYTRDDIVQQHVLRPDTEFLPKPFTFDRLAGKVREVLDARAAR